MEETNNLDKIFNFLDKMENLKNTLRWNKTSNGRQESKAEHSWRLTLMALVVYKELKLDIDINHAMKIALVHDIAEALTGDIDYRKISKNILTKEQKEKLEQGAFANLKESLPEETSIEIALLWQEYEECKTEESKFIKALDKLETVLQQARMDLKETVVDDTEYNIIASYPDKALKIYPKIEPIWRVVKNELKKNFIRLNIPWKPEYNI